MMKIEESLVLLSELSRKILEFRKTSIALFCMNIIGIVMVDTLNEHEDYSSEYLILRKTPSSMSSILFFLPTIVI